MFPLNVMRLALADDPTLSASRRELNRLRISAFLLCAGLRFATSADTPWAGVTVSSTVEPDLSSRGGGLA